MTYSYQFKLSVIRYYNMYKETTKEIYINIKHIFNVCKSTLYNWVKIVDPNVQKLNIKKIQKHKGKVTLEITNYVINKFLSDKYVTIKNICRSIKRNFNVKIKRSTIYYILKKNKLTYKKTCVNRYPHSKEKLIQEKIKLKNQFVNVNQDSIISFNEYCMHII
jgi:transposase